MQTAGVVQLPEQSMFPPHPSCTAAEQEFAGHAVAGVQHWFVWQTAGAVQLPEQSIVLPHVSSTAVAQLAAVAQVFAVHPHTPDWQGPRAQSASFPHFSPGAHCGQVPPPQSTSVSAPFLALSEHVGSGVQLAVPFV
jgi:hypothetical protein